MITNILKFNRQNHLLPFALPPVWSRSVPPSHQHWQAFFILTSLLVVWKKIFFYLSSHCEILESYWILVVAHFSLVYQPFVFLWILSQASTWLCTLIPHFCALPAQDGKICCFPPDPVLTTISCLRVRVIPAQDSWWLKDLGWLPIAPRICVWLLVIFLTSLCPRFLIWKLR